MDKNRVLIVAGTHVRENEFSYSVADKLISKYGEKEPDHVFQGMDGARQGKLWLYDGLAVAKIDKVGETSSEYLQALSRQDLINLSIFKLQHVGCKFPPSICDQFENIAQWTSVSQDLVNSSNAIMYVDLHSFHNYSKLNQTGLYIIPHARSKNVNFMMSSLKLAQIEQPEIYGVFGSDFNPLEENRREFRTIYFNEHGEVREEIAELLGEHERSFKYLGFFLRELDDSELVDFLKDDYVRGLSDLVSNSKKISSQLQNYENKSTIRLAERWGDFWLFKDQIETHQKIDSFTFEAVHWQEKQQDAVINFIDRYLLPNLNSQ